MKICDGNKEVKGKEFIPGHIYRGFSGNLYLATEIPNEKIYLTNGRKELTSMVGGGFVDVTDEYCLQKVK